MKLFFRHLCFLIALTIPLFTNAASPPLVIIESVEIGSPTAADEYIVLRNTSSSAIDISKWSLQCRSNGSATVQKKNFNAGTIIQPQESYIIANKDGRFGTTAHMTYTSLNLSDKGGILGLFSSTAYANNFEEQSLVSSINYGLATTTPTPETSASTTDNIPAATVSSTSKAVTAVTEFIGLFPEQPKKWPVLLSELLPNPISGDEFIEIANTSGEGVNVSGLWLRDASGVSYALGARGENTVLGAYEQRIWKRATTRIALNNTDGEVITLFDQSGNYIDRAIYRDDAPENAGFARLGNSWMWTTQPTPADKNIFTPVQSPPLARAVIPASSLRVAQLLTVSAEDSTDANDHIALYRWDFGDGTQSFGVTSTHAYTATGTYTISLDINDSYNAHDVVSRKILVTDTTQTTSTPLKISAASFILSKASKKSTIPSNPSHAGIVQIPPGILGHRRFVMNGRTVEFTTDRKELPLLRRGSMISFTAKEVFKTDRMLLQISAKDTIAVKALTTAPPFTMLSGTVLQTDRASFDLAASSTDFLIWSGLRYSNGDRIDKGDEVALYGVLLTDDSDRPTFVVPAAQHLKLLSKQSTTPATSYNSLFNFILLFASAGAFIILHIFLTKYGNHFSKPTYAAQIRSFYARLFKSPPTNSLQDDIQVH